MEGERKGLFLVIEGGDGSGKSSQLNMLDAFFKKGGRAVHAVHFPRLDAKPYGPMIAQFLRGEYGAVDQVHPRLAALLYALDRREAAPDFRNRLAHGQIVLADRYLHSNIAYQCAKTNDPAERDKLAAWIETLEYAEHKIPRPDLTLYLDVPDSFRRANLAADRSGPDRDYLKGRRDIHEASDRLQARVRDEFLRLVRERPGEIGRVDCAGPDGGIASRETVHSRILDALRYYGIISR